MRCWRGPLEWGLLQEQLTVGALQVRFKKVKISATLRLGIFLAGGSEQPRNTLMNWPNIPFHHRIEVEALLAGLLLGRSSHVKLSNKCSIITVIIMRFDSGALVFLDFFLRKC